MKRIKFCISLLFIFNFLLFNFTLAYADGEDKDKDKDKDTNKYVMTNDGKAKEANMLFGDCGAPPRYDNLEYYDIAIPYNETIETIGGYATGATSTGKYKFSGATSWDMKQDCRFNIFNTTTGDLDSSLFDSSGYDDNAGGLMYVEKDGIKFYIGAIGQGTFAYSAWDWSLNDDGKITGQDSLYVKGKGASSSGLFFDIILLDGTEIHFCTQSTMGAGHSIGGKQANQDKITYTLATLNYPQYKEMWHCDNPWQLVEVSAKKGSSTSGIKEALNITEENPAMYLRIWKGSLAAGSQSNTKSDLKGNKTDGKTSLDNSAGGNAKPLSTDSSGVDTTQQVSAQFAQGYYSEDQLSAFNKLCEMNFTELIGEANKDNLTSKELSSLDVWKDVVEDDKENEGFIHIVRVFVSLFGILLMVWCVLIYLAYWFDRINNLFDFDLLVILTLGKLRISETEEDCTFSLASLTKETGIRTVNHRAVLGICITGIAFGVIVISGYLYKAISALVFKVLELLGG